MPRCKAPEILRNEAYLDVRRNDEGWGQRRRWAFLSSPTRFKIRVCRRRMYQNVAFLGRRRQVDFEAFTYKELGFACGWSWCFPIESEPNQRPSSAASLRASVGALSWLQFSGSKTDDFVTRRNLNATQIGADCRKITSEFPRMLHSVFSHFLNNRVSHLSTSNSSSGEQISGHTHTDHLKILFKQIWDVKQK
jgi:hypothetical protein